MNLKQVYYFLTAILLFMYSGFVEAQNLKVFGTIPGATPSLHYKCRVKLQSEPETAWRSAFVMQSHSLNNPSSPAPGQSSTGLDNGFFKDSFGWSTSHIAFESPLNAIVEVEVSLVNGASINKSSLITKAIVKPYGEATVSISSDNKKVIVTFNKHTNVYLDINGQMEDQYTGDGYNDNTSNAKIHTLCIFANPIYNIPADAAKLTTAWSQDVGDEVALDDNYYNPKTAQTLENERVAKNNLKPAGKKFYFEPGVHNISTQFPIRSDEEYYIPGDAIVYGTFLPEANTANIKVIGSGIICGSKGRWGGKYVGVPDQKPSDAAENKVFTGNVKNAVFEGIIVLDPVNHSFNMGNSDKFNISFENKYTNLKVIGWRKNADGINAFENSTIKNCFLKTNDDCFYMGDNDMRIENNVTWTDMNGAVMYLARSTPRSYFRNTKCIYTRNQSHSNNKGVIELRDTDNDIENVTIEDLEVQDPLPTFGLFRMTVKNPNLKLNNITFKNIKMNGTRQDGRKMQMMGLSSSKWKNITFTDCSYQGTCLSSITSPLWETSNIETATIKFNCGTTNTPVTSVTVSSATLSIANGDTATLTATVLPANASNKNVSYSSSNTSVATVNSNGLVTAQAVGTAVITVTTADGNKTATSTITVTGSAPACSLPWIGTNLNVSATEVNYTSVPVNISCASAVKLSLNINGTNGVMETNQDYLKVSYRVNGGATVLAKEIWGNFPAQDVVVPGISGSTLELIIKGYTSATTEIYSVSNISIVSDGGTSNVPVTGVTIDNCPIANLVVGGIPVDLASTVLPANATNQAIVWSSSNTSVATVDASNGLVTPIAAGNASIIVTTSDGNKTASCAITVTGSTSACSLPWTNSNSNIIITKAVNSFTSNLIGIACGASEINISMNLSESTSLPLTNADKLTVLYKLDNGQEIVITEVLNDITTPIPFNINVPVSGANTLQIIIRAVTAAPDSRYDITNLNVTATNAAPANVVALTNWVSGTTHNKPSTGSNRLLVVMVMGEHSAPFSVASVTYAGKPMKKENDRVVGTTTTFNNYTSIFTLKEFDINTASSGTILVNFINSSGATITPSSGNSVYSFFLENVNQTTPTKNLVANSEPLGVSIATTAVSSNTGDLIIFSGAAGAAGDALVNNGFDKKFESSATWGDGIGGSKLSTGANEIPSFTAGSGRLAICALAVNKSSGSASRVRNDQATLSVEENLQAGTTLKLYPNPVSSILTIASDSKSEKEISVVNTLGQVVFRTKSNSQNTQIDMQSLNVSGLVLVQVIEEGKVSTHKVIVK